MIPVLVVGTKNHDLARLYSDAFYYQLTHTQPNENNFGSERYSNEKQVLTTIYDHLAHCSCVNNVNNG